MISYCKKGEKIMSAKVHLCDGDCGNVYKEEDLNSNCYEDSYCRECMCIFLMENEASKGYSEQY